MATSTQSTFHIACEREDLLTALQSADAVVPSSSAKPILTKLLLDARDGLLEIVATDLQVGLRAMIRRIEVQGAGQVVLPARQLVGILKESRSPTVDMVLQSANDQVQIELSDGIYQLPAVVGETFPTVSSFPAEVGTITLDGPVLERLLRKTAFAVDTDRTSAVLSGLLFRVGDGECLFAATDGKVLAEAIHRDPALGGADLSGIIPSTTIGHLQRILGSMHPAQVEIVLSGKLVFVRTACGGGKDGSGNVQIELTSRLVEGNYPSYRNALPTEHKGKISFRTEELISAVRRTALMTSTSSRAIVVELDDGTTVLSNLANTNGSARIPVACQGYDGRDRFGLNAQYLSEVLRAFDGDEVELELNGPGRGILIREDGVTFLIMPITLPS